MKGRLIIVGVTALVGAALVVVALVTAGEQRKGFERAAVPKREVKSLPAAASRAGCRVARFAKEGDGVTDRPVSYRTNPPHSGKHAREPADDGAYYARAPATEAIVHALRHGRIVLWFDPDLDEREKGRLKALFDEDSPHMIIAPREGLPYDTAASAWRGTVTCPEIGDATFDALRAFRDRWRDRGPEFVP